jgi:DNA-binding response OmpR family regulator
MFTTENMISAGGQHALQGMVEMEMNLVCQSHSWPAILIVAEDLPLRRMIRIALANAGLQAFAASNAEHALQILSSHADEIGLVITDLVMSHMGGLDLANEVGTLRPAIKMLYISGYLKSVVAQSMAQTNPGAVLLKPFTGPQIVARVLELLRDRSTNHSGRGGDPAAIRRLVLLLRAMAREVHPSSDELEAYARGLSSDGDLENFLLTLVPASPGGNEHLLSLDLCGEGFSVV